MLILLQKNTDKHFPESEPLTTLISRYFYYSFLCGFLLLLNTKSVFKNHGRTFKSAKYFKRTRLFEIPPHILKYTTTTYFRSINIKFTVVADRPSCYEAVGSPSTCSCARSRRSRTPAEYKACITLHKGV